MIAKSIIIVGKMGVGKTSVANYLCRVYSTHSMKYERVITYTTRAKRPDEPLNAYHFVSNEEFDAMKDNEEFVETSERSVGDNLVQYGSRIEDYAPSYDTDGHLILKVIILDPRGMKEALKLIGPGNLTVIYLKADEKVLRERLAARGTDSQDVINARLLEEAESFKDVSCRADLTINCNTTGISAVANIIDQYLHGSLF